MLGVACIGGVVSALLAAVTASLLMNYYFIPPIDRFTIDEGNNVLALIAFAIVAATVAAVVDRSLRLGRQAAAAAAEAETLSSLASSILRGDKAVPALLERTRETFGMESVELSYDKREMGHRAMADGDTDSAYETRVPIGTDSVLVLRGRRLPASEHRVLTAFAAHLTAAVERARLAEVAAEVEPVKAADRMRPALLAAVSHDLRTPLAGCWAAVSSLRSRDVDFSQEDREELLATAEESLAKLNRLVDNLLDMSRLQAGALNLRLEPTALAEVLPLALDALPEPAVPVVTQHLESTPQVLADPPLLERVIANLVANAVRNAPPGLPVTLSASTLAPYVEVRVTTEARGFGRPTRNARSCPSSASATPTTPPVSDSGSPLSRGLTEAMGGTLTPEDTPGGGLTMVVSLPAAPTPATEALA
ncbi:DUF4118 domain-containing protein [Streptomyces olivoreticuli]